MHSGIKAKLEEYGALPQYVELSRKNIQEQSLY